MDIPPLTTSMPDWLDDADDTVREDRGFDKLQQAIWNDGYKDALSASKDSHLQTGFEEGYIRSVSKFIQLGELRGRLQALLRFANPPLSPPRLAVVRNVLGAADLFFQANRQQPPATDKTLAEFHTRQDQLQIEQQDKIHEFIDRGAKILDHNDERDIDIGEGTNFFTALP